MSNQEDVEKFKYMMLGGFIAIIVEIIFKEIAK